MKKTLGTTEKGGGKNEQSFLTPKRIFIGLTSLGALGFGFWALTRKSNKPASDQGLSFDSPKDETQSPGDKPATEKPKKSETKAPVKSLWPKSSDLVTTKPASDFPLKRGSKNDKVKELQQTLNAKYPGLIKNPDGKFGDETEKALKSKGLPSEISESQFKVLTAIDPQTTADNIYNAAKSKDYKTALSQLQQIKTASDYSAVSEKIKLKPALITQYTNQSLLNVMVYTFTEQSQKDQLALEFTRMGLTKGTDGKWTVPSATVSGIERRTIITKQPTKVWHNAKHMVQVGKDTVLGYEVQSADGITIFDSIDGYRLFVMTAHVKYH